MQKVSKEKIARAYAASLLEVSNSQGKENIVKQELEAIDQSIKNSPQEWGMLLNQQDRISENEEIIKTLTKKLKTTDLMFNVLNLLNENSRLSLLPKVIEKYKELYFEEKSIVSVKVETVIPLTASQDKKLKKVLVEKLKKDVEITYTINESILGGLRISYGTYQIDDTLSTKINEIQKKLKG
ncbi:MAG: ATP synthase F1 subunit delta [Alphaproteobacteria bacterium]|nr:ATP synthase F1 subunit delta [Alphaproteobacteria bacterium]